MNLSDKKNYIWSRPYDPQFDIGVGFLEMDECYRVCLATRFMELSKNNPPDTTNIGCDRYQLTDILTTKELDHFAAMTEDVLFPYLGRNMVVRSDPMDPSGPHVLCNFNTHAPGNKHAVHVDAYMPCMHSLLCNLGPDTTKTHIGPKVDVYNFILDAIKTCEEEYYQSTLNNFESSPLLLKFLERKCLVFLESHGVTAALQRKQLWARGDEWHSGIGMVFNASNQTHAANRGIDGNTRQIMYVSIISWDKFLPEFPTNLREAKWSLIKNARGLERRSKVGWRTENAFTSEVPVNLENGHDSSQQPVLSPLALLTAMIMVRETMSWEKDVVPPTSPHKPPKKRKLGQSTIKNDKHFKGVLFMYLQNVLSILPSC